MSDSEALFDTIANEMLSKGDTKRGKMFGSPCISVNGKVFATFRNDMTFKLSEEAREHALRIEGAHLFDPGMGRPMKEWVTVPAAQSQQWRSLADEAYAYVADISTK